MADEVLPMKPASIPPRASKSVVYANTVRKFAASADRSVEVGGRKPATLYQQLVKALKEEDIKGIKVVRRGDDVFLQKV